MLVLARLKLVGALAAGAVAASAAPALAAPPANDGRAAPQTLTAGADVRGTTVEATREPTDPPACPKDGGATVWYSYDAPRAGSARLLLQTEGGLDATVAVYEQENSTLTRVGCAQTSRGTLLADVSLDDGPYLIRVSQNEGSQPGAFRLRFSGVLTTPTPPGAALPANGIATGSLNPFTRPFAQFSRTLRAGHDYRVRVGTSPAGEDCQVLATLYDATGDPVRRFGCRGYDVITPGPGEGGRWTIGLEAGGSDAQDIRYEASITGVGSDDLAPGHFLGAFGVARDSVSGRAPDAEDVYRLDVTKRAEITLKIASKGAVSVALRTERGRAVTSASADGDTGQLRTRLRPGRFYAIVSAAESAGGRYTLSRLTRVITSTKVSWGRSQQGPGGSGTVQVRVNGAGHGSATVTLQRFDPQFGWRYWQTRHVPIRGGSGSFTVPTGEIGRYRAIAEYGGTRDASPSRARSAAYLRVVSALSE